MIALQKLVDPQPVPAPIIESSWFVMLTEPQQDLTTVWRLHELGIEMFVPVIRRRVKTGRVGRNGQKVTRIIPKPMFPGYGFLRCTETNNPAGLVWRERHGSGIRGVREFMRDPDNKPVRLPHAAVQAVFRKQMEEQQDWLATAGGRGHPAWKHGDKVRIDQDGGVYAGLVATVDKLVGKDRISVLLGMIRHTLTADMVVAA